MGNNLNRGGSDCGSCVGGARVMGDILCGINMGCIVRLIYILLGLYVVQL